MDLPIRPWTPADDQLVIARLERAFLDEPDPDASPVELAVLEHDRTLAVWDGDDPVGTAAAYSFQAAVPGAVVPVAGVTWVSVQPTHRRRGLLRRLMTTQLEQLHDSGEAVAALWASEPGIYGRFGYGGASRTLSVTLQRGDLLRPGVGEPAGRVVEVDPQQAREQLAQAWDAVWPQRPGQYARDQRWWDVRLLDPKGWRDGATALRCVLLLGDDGAPRGYALFAAKDARDDRGMAREVRVREVVGQGEDVVRLWRFLLGLDLTVRWTADGLALDDPLLGAVVDPRRLVARWNDNLYVRPVRVDEAMTSRRYAADVDVVLDVRDDQLPANARRWRLTAGPDGASCTPTTDAADLGLSVEELGAAYLGGTTLASLAAAGRVQEHTAGTLAATSRALRGDVEPACSMVF